ncbi:MAG TPA: hypothetical protein VF066_01900 [Thermoleophilaceae bacterium]
MSRTTDDYTPMAVGTLPPQPGDTPSLSPDGTNHVAATHIGDMIAVRHQLSGAISPRASR